MLGLAGSHNTNTVISQLATLQLYHALQHSHFIIGFCVCFSFVYIQQHECVGGATQAVM